MSSLAQQESLLKALLWPGIKTWVRNCRMAKSVGTSQVIQYLKPFYSTQKRKALDRAFARPETPGPLLSAIYIFLMAFIIFIRL